MEKGRSVFKVLTGKHTEKRLEEKFKMYIKKIDVSTRNWIDSAYERNYRVVFLDVVLILRVP